MKKIAGVVFVVSGEGFLPDGGRSVEFSVTLLPGACCDNSMRPRSRCSLLFLNPLDSRKFSGRIASRNNFEQHLSQEQRHGRATVSSELEQGTERLVRDFSASSGDGRRWAAKVASSSWAGH